MPTIYITGANGQVGQELRIAASDFKELECHFLTRADLDISDSDAVRAYFEERPFDYLINTAAYTAVDQAESDTEAARTVNVDAVRYLAEACARRNAILVHYSSDYVYHNGLDRPLREDDPTTPQGVYAATKLEGEQVARDTCQALILRTSWVHSNYGHNFVKTIRRLAQSRPELTVVNDQIGTPTYARDLAYVTLSLIHKVECEQCDRDLLDDTYNYSDEGVAGWYDFARAIVKHQKIACTITPVPSSSYPTAAKRPSYSILDKSKIKAAFGLSIPHWENSLIRALNVEVNS